MKVHLGLFIIVSIFLTSCNMQKRLYNKGFYVHINQPIKKINTTDNLLALAENKSQKRKSTFFIHSNQVFDVDTILKPKCDTIYTKKGEIIVAKKINIGITKTRFKYCGQEEGSKYILNNNQIKKINCANGQIKDKLSKKVNSLAVIGSILSLYTSIQSLLEKVWLNRRHVPASFFISFYFWFLFFFFLLSLTFLVIGIIQIRRHPDTQSGWFLIILGLAFLLLSIILLVAALLV